jgi:hypothetical protein
MPLFIFQVVYYVILVFMLIAGFFVVYHIIKYSYDKTATLLMLIIFCGVFAVIVSTNFTLFSNIGTDDIESLLSF